VRWALAAILAFASLQSAAANASDISQAQARKIALARVPGTVVHEKLKHSKKKNKGHDHWNVKIAPRDKAKAGYVRKVEVDASTGEIIKIKDVKAKSETED
jgi:uncharacterized membrane protein YkoI